MRRMALILAGLAIALAQGAGAVALPGNFIGSAKPKPLPNVSFVDGSGQKGNLSELRGKYILLNVWATWCVPCRKEMPTLDRLQAALGGPDFLVAPLSIDRLGPATVRKFFAEIKVKNLAIRVDSSGAALRSLDIIGLPTTILIDPKGRELGRVIGPADWDQPSMIAALERITTQDPQNAANKGAQP